MTQDPGSASSMSDRMQSLLSRAVEDQLSEQRQLAGALAEVRAQLAALSAQLGALQQPAPAADAAVEPALAGIAADVREAVRLLAQRIDAVGSLVHQRGHDLAEIRASIAELTEALQRHTTAVDGVTGGLAALPAFGDRIDTLQSGLGGLHERLQGLEELTASVRGMAQRVEALDGGVRELRHAFTGIAARAAELPGRPDLEAMLSRVVDPAEVLGNRVARIESALPSLLERLDALAAAMTAQGERLASVGAGVSALAENAAEPDEGGRATTGVELREIRARLDELHERTGDSGVVDELIERLDVLRDALLGDDGLAPQVAALTAAVDAATAEDEPGEEVEDQDVEDLVARAVAASEQRLAEHIDGAVLALAEVVLRRRSTRAAGRAEILAASNPSPLPAAAPETVAAAEPVPAAEAPPAAEPAAPPTAAPPAPPAASRPGGPAGALLGDALLEEDDEGEGDDDEVPLPPEHPQAASAPAAGAGVNGAGPDGDDADADADAGDPAATGGKRKPWWRPGD